MAVYEQVTPSKRFKSVMKKKESFVIRNHEQLFLIL